MDLDESLKSGGVSLPLQGGYAPSSFQLEKAVRHDESAGGKRGEHRGTLRGPGKLQVDAAEKNQRTVAMSETTQRRKSDIEINFKDLKTVDQDLPET